MADLDVSSRVDALHYAFYELVRTLNQQRALDVPLLIDNLRTSEWYQREHQPEVHQEITALIDLLSHPSLQRDRQSPR